MSIEILGALLLLTAIVVAGLFGVIAIRRRKGGPGTMGGQSETRTTGQACSRDQQPDARPPSNGPSIRQRGIDPGRVLETERPRRSLDGWADYATEFESTLEHAFSLYERGRLSLSGYIDIIQKLDDRLGRDRASGQVWPPNPVAWDELVDAVQWCLEWARERDAVTHESA